MKRELIENNPMLKMTFDLSLSIINFCDQLNAGKIIISNQLLKSGASISANAMEAQNAESKADFIHKIKIAAKEADKTQYRLMLCSYSKNYSECDTLILKLEGIQKVINKVLSSSKEKKLQII